VNVSSKPTQVMADGFLKLHDIDINDLRLLCLKSSQHFKAYYASAANKIITVDPPGIHTSNLNLLIYKNVRRPIYPLDLDAKFNNYSY
jgi:microcystin degradation protein MlrC